MLLALVRHLRVIGAELMRSWSGKELSDVRHWQIIRSEWLGNHNEKGAFQSRIVAKLVRFGPDVEEHGYRNEKNAARMKRISAKTTN